MFTRSFLQCILIIHHSDDKKEGGGGGGGGAIGHDAEIHTGWRETGDKIPPKQHTLVL